MSEIHHCPYIPLKNYRTNQLFEFIHELLNENPGIQLQEIYNQVLEFFGEENCCPELLCPHGSEPEYWHVVRLTLWDGKDNNIFDSDGEGHWRIKDL